MHPSRARPVEGALSRCGTENRLPPSASLRPGVEVWKKYVAQQGCRKIASRSRAYGFSELPSPPEPGVWAAMKSGTKSVESTAIRADFSPERELEGPDCAKKSGYRTFWHKHRQGRSPPARGMESRANLNTSDGRGQRVGVHLEAVPPRTFGPVQPLIGPLDDAFDRLTEVGSCNSCRTLAGPGRWLVRVASAIQRRNRFAA
jgi:hypothetical protein